MKTITLKQFVCDLNNFYNSLSMVTTINNSFEIIEDLYDTDFFDIDDSKINLYYN